MTKYISSKDSVTFEETVEAAELFKKQTVTIISNHSFIRALTSVRLTKQQ
jgi:hypothetical protein